HPAFVERIVPIRAGSSEQDCRVFGVFPVRHVVHTLEMKRVHIQPCLDILSKVIAIEIIEANAEIQPQLPHGPLVLNVKPVVSGNSALPRVQFGLRGAVRVVGKAADELTRVGAWECWQRKQAISSLPKTRWLR